MDNGCITFHVIANSSKKKTPKNQKNKNKQSKNQTVPDKQSPGDTGTCPVSSLVQTAHAFPLPDLGHNMRRLE